MNTPFERSSSVIRRVASATAHWFLKMVLFSLVVIIIAINAVKARQNMDKNRHGNPMTCKGLKISQTGILSGVVIKKAIAKAPIQYQYSFIDFKGFLSIVVIASATINKMPVD